jgi:hypothetical protein
MFLCISSSFSWEKPSWNQKFCRHRISANKTKEHVISNLATLEMDRLGDCKSYSRVDKKTGGLAQDI